MMKIDKASIRRNAAKIRRLAEFALDASQGFMLLTRSSHPVAWVAAALHLYQRIERRMPEKPRIWTEYGTSVCEAIVDALFRHSAGDVVGEDSRGDPIRAVGRVTFSWDGDNMGGPWGDPQDRSPFEWIWDNLGPHLCLRQTLNDIELDRDRDRKSFEPTSAILSIAKDASAMKVRGHRVGVLLNGPPGAGKTAALWSIAERLGGRTLRASQVGGHSRRSQPEFIANMCAALRPDCLIIDDIDRVDGSTAATLLECVEWIMEGGTAVLASCNRRSAIADALIRSGRIDDKYYVGPIEPEILDRLKDRLTADEAETLRGHTVATVMRYLEKRDAVSIERAAEFLAGEERVPSTEREWEDEGQCISEDDEGGEFDEDDARHTAALLREDDRLMAKAIRRQRKLIRLAGEP